MSPLNSLRLLPTILYKFILAPEKRSNFFFDENEKIIGFDKKNPLSKTKGKVEIVKNLKLNGTIHVLGDGYTDFEIKKDGYADYFYLFIENIKRESLTKNADFLVKSFDHFKNIVK